MDHPDKLRSTRERIVTAEVRKLELRQAKQRSDSQRRSMPQGERARHDSPPPPASAAPCDHLLEPTSRYDDEHKLLTFLLSCPGCGTQKVVTTLPYEPAFRPTAA